MPHATSLDPCLSPEMLRQYLAHELPGDVETSVLTHLLACLACQALCDSVAKNDRLLKARVGRVRAEEEIATSGSSTLSDELCQADDPYVTVPTDRDDVNWPQTAPINDTAEAPRHFSGYELLEEIARGGMGVVYKARQTRLDRVVAVKMILAGEFASADGVRRFMIEAQAAANLDHPHIVPIFEVGECAGRHFYSMGYVEGESLARKVTRGPLPSREAAELVRKVALAIDYAHRRGLIHRDIKPQNVLLDSTGEPRVTDFGLAKRVQNDSELTSTGQILGTPSYMPPEQARGDVSAIGTLADVYSLGALLYCLLTGRPPFQTSSVMETLKQVLEADPVPPRQLNPHIPRDLETIVLKCLEKSPVRRFGTARMLAEEIDRFLNGQPIHARPVGRPERAWRWCRRNPIVALTSSVATTLLLAVATVSTVAYFREADLRQEVQAKERATSNALMAESTAKRAALRASTAERAASQIATTQAGLAKAKSHELARTLYNADLNRIEHYAQSSNVERIDALLRRHIPKSADEEDLRGFEWYYWWRFAHQQRAALHLPKPAEKVAISPDGTTIVAACEGGEAYLFDMATRQRRAEILKIPGQHWSTLQFANDGRLLGAGWQGDRRAWDLQTGYLSLIHDVETTDSGGMVRWPTLYSPDGREVLTFVFGGMSGMQWQPLTGGSPIALSELSCGLYIYPGAGTNSPYGRYLKTFSHHQTTSLTTDEGQLAHNLVMPKVALDEYGVPVFGMTYSPNGQWCAGGTRDGRVHIYRMDTKSLVRSLAAHEGIVWCVSFSPDGRLLATAGADGEVQLWDVDTGSRLARCRGHQGAVRALTFIDSTICASGGEDGQIILWETPDGLKIGDLRGHAGRIQSLAASGQRLVSSGIDRSVRVWEIGDSVNSFTPPADGYATHLIASADERLLFIPAIQGGGVHILDAKTGRYRGRIAVRDVADADVALSPDGNTIAAATFRSLTFWKLNDLRPDGEIVPPKHSPNCQFDKVAWSPDGRLIAVGARASNVRTFPPKLSQLAKTETSVIHIYRAGDRQLLRNISFPGAPADRILFSPQGDRVTVITTGATDAKENRTVSGQVLQFDVETGTNVASYPEKNSDAVFSAAAASPDGQWLALASNTPTRQALLLRAASLQEHVVIAASHPTTGLYFSADSQRLTISGGLQAQESTLWDVATQTVIATSPVVHSANALGYGQQRSLLIDRGKTLVAMSGNISPIYRQDVPSQSWLAPWPIAGGAVHGVKLSPHGDFVATEAAPVHGLLDHWSILNVPGATREVQDEEVKSYFYFNNRRKGLGIAGMVSLNHPNKPSARSQQLQVVDPFCFCSPHGLGGLFRDLLDIQTLTEKFPESARGSILRTERSRDGQLLATVHDDGHIVVWKDRPTLAKGRMEPLIALRAKCRWLAFSPNADWLALADEREVRLLARFGHESFSLGQHDGGVNGVTWSPDGRRVASASDDGTIKVWDIDARRELRNQRPHLGKAISVLYMPDGRTLVSGGEDGFLVFQDSLTGEVRSRIKGHEGPINDLDVTADGRLLVSAGEDGRVRLWRATSPVEFDSMLNDSPLEIPPDAPVMDRPAPLTAAEIAEREAAEQLLRCGWSLVVKSRNQVIPLLRVHSSDLQSPSLALPEGKVEVTSAFGSIVSWIPSIRGYQPDGAWPAPTNEDIQKLNRFPKLEWISINSPSITAAGLQQLQGVASLRELTVINSSLGVVDLSFLNSCRELETLVLFPGRIDSRSLAALARFSKLKLLEFDGVGITDDDLVAFWPLRELTMLRLPNSKLTDRGLATLTKLSLLKSLDVSGSNISDAAFASLTELPDLQWLDVRGTGISARAVLDFAGSRKIMRVHTSDEIAGDRWEQRALIKAAAATRTEGIPRVALGKALTEWADADEQSWPVQMPRATSMRRFAEEHAQKFALSELDVQMLESLRSLTALTLSNSSAGANDLERILAGKPLLKLILAGDYSDVELQPIGEIKTLQSLSVNSSRITPAGLNWLADLPALSSLTLNCPKVNLQLLAESVPALNELTIVSAGLTDDDLQHLTKFSVLRSLDCGDFLPGENGVRTLETLHNLQSLKIKASAAAMRLRNSLPNCKVNGLFPVNSWPRN